MAQVTAHDADERLTRVAVTIACEAAPGIADVLLSLVQGIEERVKGRRVCLIAHMNADTAEAAAMRVRERLDALAAAGIDAGRAVVTVRRVRSKKWEEICRASFSITHVPPRIVIKPTWLAYSPRTGEAVVELDPGMAFGTGQHATTRGCLRALGHHVRAGAVVFDVGTGSGILAIAAAKLGARKVVAIELDPAAARIAARNAAVNEVESVARVVVGNGLWCVRGHADIVVANLTSHDIVALAAAIRSRLRAGGLFIASGIAAGHGDRVVSAAERTGLALRDLQREGEWLTMVWEAADSAPASD